MSSLEWRHMVGMGGGIAMVVMGLLGLLGALNQGPIVLAILVGLATVEVAVAVGVGVTPLDSPSP